MHRLLKVVLLLTLFGFSKADAQVFDGYLVFPTELNGIKLIEKNIEYDFAGEKSFQLGRKEFKYTGVFATLTVIGQAPRVLHRSAHKHHRILALQWPKELIEFGELQFIETRKNNVVFEERIGDESLGLWRTAPERMREMLYPTWGETKLRWLGPRVSFKRGRFGLFPIPKDLNQVLGRDLRYCVTEENALNFTKMCSVIMHKDTQGRMRRSQVQRKQKTILKVNGKEAPLAGELAFSQNFDFSVQSSTGFSYQFKGKPIKANVVQILQSDDYKEELEVLGHGVFPHGAKPFGDGPRLLEKLGWQDSILPEKHYWNLAVLKETPSIPALTSGASFIGYQIDSENGYPSKKDRLKITKTPRATYSSSVEIKGECQKECNLKATGKDELKTSGKEFVWKIKTPLKNTQNFNQISVIGETSKTWTAQNEIFRATSTEVSSRFSGFATTDSVFSVLGELSFAHWFESLLGWQNSLLSYQRWGLRASYSKTLKGINIANNLEEQSLSTLNADLKYRFKSGVSGLNETVGLNLSYQQSNLSGRNLPLVGGGIFWEKSMPVIFDKLLNYLPYMDYPKWVDMEFVVYPTSLSSEVTTNLMWNLNFHGKVLWSKSFFGEMGFGIRSFDLIDQIQEQQFKFFSAYITLGVGAQF